MPRQEKDHSPKVIKVVWYVGEKSAMHCWFKPQWRAILWPAAPACPLQWHTPLWQQHPQAAPCSGTLQRHPAAAPCSGTSMPAPKRTHTLTTAPSSSTCSGILRRHPMPAPKGRHAIATPLLEVRTPIASLSGKKNGKCWQVCKRGCKPKSGRWGLGRRVCFLPSFRPSF